MMTFKTGITARTIQISLFTGVFLLLMGILTPVTIMASPDIQARYIKDSGKQVVISITVGQNPPPSVILVQHFPPGVRMVDSTPKASNYNHQRNSAKWLLRNLRSGKTNVSVSFDRPVQGGQVSAEIRFKPQRKGKMSTIPVR